MGNAYANSASPLALHRDSTSSLRLFLMFPLASFELLFLNLLVSGFFPSNKVHAHTFCSFFSLLFLVDAHKLLYVLDVLVLILVIACISS